MNARRVTLKGLRKQWGIFALLAPTLVGVAIFNYTPAVEAVRHSLYNWDGAYTEEYIGSENFRRIFGDLALWLPLLIGGVCAGLSALIERPLTRKVLRILGVIGMTAAAVVLVRDARSLADGIALKPFLLLFVPAAVCIPLGLFLRPCKKRSAARLGAFLLPFIAGVAYLVVVRKIGDQMLWMSFRLIFILILANLLKMWPSIFTAVCIHRLKSDRMQYLYRVLFVVPMIIPQMVALLVWKFFYDPNVGALNKIIVATGLDNVLVWLDKWVFHLGVFVEPFKPAWLGDPSLIIPALIFWGFPWVGVVGVLIYLAGLQNIGADVYEAAEIDGINWWNKFWRIELPLIMTQVRLNLILMVIGTLQAYGFQLILLGPEGGPRNKGLTPGLYMFYRAFLNQDYGYACALGMILFVIILALTVINQRYVRVEK